MVFDHDHDFDDQGMIKGQYLEDEVQIDEGCWIGAGCIILRGTHIGAHSVVGAGCIVKGDIPSYSLVKMSRELRITRLEKR